MSLYLVDHADALAISTLRRRIAAISEAHQVARFETPTIDATLRLTWAGIRRTHGKALDAKEAAVTEVVAAMVAPLTGRLIDVRNRAIPLLGFAGAPRRSELSRSTSLPSWRRGRGCASGLVGRRPTKRAWRARLDRSYLGDGPAFRRLSYGRVTPDCIAGDGIARTFKRRAKAAGYTPDLPSGHSLRSGFAATAARAGVAEHRIMRQGGWTTSQAMRGYIQEGELFVDNPSAKLGL